MLLQDPTLIQREVEKRVADTKRTSPSLHQKASFEKQRGKAVLAMDKLLDAYQEGLIPIAQLRKRMPELQKKVNTLEKELEQLKAHELSLDQRLQLLDVPSFTNQIDQNLHQLDIKEKKKILRLLVKEIIVGDDIIDIKHSIPLKETENENNEKSYQLCTKSDNPQSGDVYIFIGKRGNQIRLLQWDKDGFALYTKRLEEGTFERPAGDEIRLTDRQLLLILQGVRLASVRLRKRFNSPVLAASPST